MRLGLADLAGDAGAEMETAGVAVGDTDESKVGLETVHAAHVRTIAALMIVSKTGRLM